MYYNHTYITKFICYFWVGELFLHILILELIADSSSQMTLWTYFRFNEWRVFLASSPFTLWLFMISKRTCITWVEWIQQFLQLEVGHRFCRSKWNLMKGFLIGFFPTPKDVSNLAYSMQKVGQMKDVDSANIHSQLDGWKENNIKNMDKWKMVIGPTYTVN